MDGFFELLRIPQVIFGIGLVIFVHEAGHFIAAKLCKVRVEIFSLGFGPKLIGWQRGHTLYQIAMVPLGGFVKMAGDEMDRPRDLPPRSWELGSKSVPQRFFIYSGGVLMNVLFALIAFPMVLLSGLPSTEPSVGEPIPGSPAWKAGFPAYSKVLRVNDREVFDYMHIPGEVAHSGKRAAVFEVLAPGETTPRVIELTPVYVDNPGIYQVGLPPMPDADRAVAVQEGGPAAAAGLTEEDHLLGVVGGVSELSVERQLSLAQRSKDPIVLRVADGAGAEREITVEPSITTSSKSKILGVGLAWTHLADLRTSELTEATGLQVDDRLLWVQGRRNVRRGDVLEALLEASETGDPLRFTVLRSGQTLELTGPTVTRAQALELESDLHVTADFDAVRVAALAGGAAAEAGLLDGDLVLSIQGQRVESWEDFQKAAASVSRSGKEALLSVLRTDPATGEKKTLEIQLTPRDAELVSYGFNLRQAEYVYQAPTAKEALTVGVTASWRFLVDTARTLRRMLTNEVSTENLGGIITISVVSHSFAEQGWGKLFFFLCLLSMNLAILNVLPIPVLDGGHLFFLLVEGIKGSPVSERTLGYSQMVGLVLILSLMVYVTYNDIARWFLT